MTFRRKVSATCIFIFIFIWFLYNSNIYPVITAGASEGEGIGRCLATLIVLSCIARSPIVFLELWLDLCLQTSLTLPWCVPLL